MSFFAKPGSNIPNNALNVNTKIPPSSPPKEKKILILNLKGIGGKIICITQLVLLFSYFIYEK